MNDSKKDKDSIHWSVYLLAIVGGFALLSWIYGFLSPSSVEIAEDCIDDIEIEGVNEWGDSLISSAEVYACIDWSFRERHESYDDY